MRTVPPALLEYGYYLQLFYATMAPALGLSFGSLGILMLGAVGAGCVASMGRYSLPIMRSVAVPIACGLSFFAIQILVHGSSLEKAYTREWIPWMAGVVVLQHLAWRPGFLHRASLALFILGVATLPYARTVGVEDRTGLSADITIANPNDLGAWFGFCCVYFAIVGLEVRRHWLRAIAWTLAVASLLILGLSVSRGPLFAVGLSLVFALRRVLKKGFLPLVFLITAGWIAFALGLFDRSAALYAQRGLEETGRFQVWPIAVQRFLESPLAGVGADNVLTHLPSVGLSVTPHNGPIFIALAAGIVPLLLFLTYAVQLIASASKASPYFDGDAPFHRALLLYALLIVMNLNAVFMLPWVMVIFASVSVSGLRGRALLALADRARQVGVDAPTRAASAATTRPVLN